MSVILSILVVLWILSPLILIPLTLYYKKYQSNYLTEQYRNKNLKNLIQSMIIRGALTEKEKELYCNYIGAIYNKPSPTDNENSVRETERNQDGLQNQVLELSKVVEITEPIFKDSTNPVVNNISHQDAEQKEKIFYEEKSPLVNNDDNTYYDYQYSRQPVRVKQSNNISTISIVLIIGVIFVLLAGIIFTTTTWNSLNNLARSALIFSASILFFAVGSISEKKLKLEKTGMAFFSIGCFLLPIDIFTVGVFRLFGDWLSWGGDGKFLLSAIGSLLLTIASYKGIKKYVSKFYSYVFLVGASSTVVLILKSVLISANSGIFTICIALYLLIILFLQDNIKGLLISIQNNCISVWEPFLISNIFILAIISLFTSHMGVLSGISIILFAIVFICYTNSLDSKVSYIYLFSSLIFLIVGLIQVFGFKEYFLIITIMILSFTIVQELIILKDVSKNFFNNILFVLLIFGLILLPFNLTNWINTICIIAIILCSTWIYIKQDVKSALYIQSFYAIFLSINISLVVTDNIQFSMLLISCLVFGVFLIYQFVNRLRNQVSLIVCTSVIGLLLLSANGFYFDYKLIISIVWFAMIIINLIKHDNICNLSRYILPLSMISIVWSIDFSYTILPRLIVFSILLLISIILNFKNIRNLQKIFDIYTISIGYIYSLTSFMDSDNNLKLYLGLLAIFSLFKMVICKIHQVNIEKILYTNLSFINLVLFTVAFEGISLEIKSFVLSAILFATYYIVRKIQIDDDILKIMKFYTIAILEVSQWYICLGNGHFTISLMIIVMNFFFSYNFRNNILTVFSIFNLYYVLNDLVSYDLATSNINNRIVIFNVIFFIAMGVIGRYLHKNFVDKDKKTKKYYIDYFTIFSLVPIFRLLSISLSIYNLNIFIMFILLSIYPMFYYNRILISNGKQILLTISSIFLCFVFWSQPFLTIINILSTEWNCIPIVLLSLVLCKVWRDNNIILEYAPFFSACIVTFILSISQILSKEVIDALILIALLMTYIVISKMLNMKKWKLLSTILFCIIFWSQPFFTPPDIFITEWNCIPLIILALTISFIWREYPKIIEYLPFGTTMLVSIILSISAIMSQQITDAFILLIGLLSILIIAFMIKRKKWFCFSTIELICLTIYLTRDFWISIAWWIYLLIVGLLMITIGATNEYLKVKNENLKDNLKASTKRMFQDWKW